MQSSDGRRRMSRRFATPSVLLVRTFISNSLHIAQLMQCLRALPTVSVFSYPHPLLE